MTTKILLIALFLSQILLPQKLSHPLRAESFSRTAVRSNSAVSFPDTLKVLAILVQFRKDVDSRTSDSGRFDLSVPPKRIIDSPPHDSAYFADHFTFAQNYYFKASNGKQNIATTVFGKVITLNKEMKDYAPVNNNLPLVEMIKEAWYAVDSLYPGEIPYQQYSMFTIFHAGVGKDIDLRASLGYDPTPLDIPSLYFNLSSLQNLLGNSFQGFPLKNSTFKIPNTAVLPETEVRKIESVGGDFVLKLSINGLLIASIGSHLGLPDLFDTKTGKTAIGRFGLMDGQSIFSFSGICPPEPSAWEKIFLGWTTPIEILGNQALRAPAVGLYPNPTGNDTIYKIPISAKEYFLVENRNRDAQQNGHFVSMKWNGQTIQRPFTKDEEYFTNSNIDSVYGVVVDVDELDWSLPGIINANNDYRGGILIWHIDETIIEKNIASNTINADPKKRGIDLEEADGSQDLGQSYDFGHPASGSEDGSPIDYWFNGNIFPNYKNEFSENTNPNSLSNTYAKSHVTLKNFSVVSPQMTFEANVDGDGIKLVKTIKRNSLRFSETDSPILVDLTSDYSPEVIYTDGDSIFLLNDDFQPFVNNSGLLSPKGGQFHPAVSFEGFANAVGSGPTIYGIQDSSVYMFTKFTGIPPNVSDSIVIKKLTSKVTTAVIKEGILKNWGNSYVGLLNGAVYNLTLGTYSSSSTSNKPVVAISNGFKFLEDFIYYDNFNEGNSYTSKILSGAVLTGGILVSVTEDNRINFQINVTQRKDVKLDGLSSSFALADLNDDNNLDVIIGAKDKLYAFNSNGTILDHFPIKTLDGGSVVGSPIVVTLKQTGQPSIIFGSTNGHLYGIDQKGVMLKGFPLQTSGIYSAPTFSQNVLAVSSTDSLLYFWKIDNLFDSTGSLNQWTGYLGGFYHPNMNNNLGGPRLKSSELLPKKFAYNWPNPVYSGSTNIRYFLGKSGTVKIKIVNLAGELVEELNGTSYAGMDNEVQWNISKIQSGIYFAQITASSGGEEQSQIVKIAVVK